MPSLGLRDFVMQEERPELAAPRTGISLFSGSGLSDLGYEMSGFQFHVQVELDERRADIGSDNFPKSTWITGDVRTSHHSIARAYNESASQQLDLLVATPPCQGMRQL